MSRRQPDDDDDIYVRASDMAAYMATKATRQGDRTERILRAFAEGENRLLIPTEVAKMLHTTTATVWQMVRDGTMVGFLLTPRLLRIPISEVEAVLATRQH